MPMTRAEFLQGIVAGVLSMVLPRVPAKELYVEMRTDRGEVRQLLVGDQAVFANDGCWGTVEAFVIYDKPIGGREIAFMEVEEGPLLSPCDSLIFQSPSAPYVTVADSDWGWDSDG